MQCTPVIVQKYTKYLYTLKTASLQYCLVSVHSCCTSLKQSVGQCFIRAKEELHFFYTYKVGSAVGVGTAWRHWYEHFEKDEKRIVQVQVQIFFIKVCRYTLLSVCYVQWSVYLCPMGRLHTTFAHEYIMPLWMVVNKISVAMKTNMLAQQPKTWLDHHNN